MVDIKTQEILRLYARSEDVNKAVTNDLNNSNIEFENICNNVNCSELTSATEGLKIAVSNIATTIDKTLPVVATFMLKQANLYSETETTTDEEINTLVNTIYNNIGLESTE